MSKYKFKARLAAVTMALASLYPGSRKEDTPEYREGSPEPEITPKTPQSQNLIQFDKWYQQKELWYVFEAIPHGGTNAIVRGDPDILARFIFALDRMYHEEGTYRLGQIAGILYDTFESGQTQANPSRAGICFGNDRIRVIKRLDDESLIGNNGPFSGSPMHIEIIHNEQYGGSYPGNPPLSSRAGMIDKVQKALEKMD